MTTPAIRPQQREEDAGQDRSEPKALPEQSATYGRSGEEHDSLACLGAELMRRAEESQPALETAWDELLATWGIHGEPLGIQRLRGMIQQESGGKPDDNEFSRELIALREERRP
jgi:hypothetical protein